MVARRTFECIDNAELYLVSAAQDFSSDTSSERSVSSHSTTKSSGKSTSKSFGKESKYKKADLDQSLLKVVSDKEFNCPPGGKHEQCKHANEVVETKVPT